MIAAPGITVNDVKITSDQINQELQYHPSGDMAGARYQAMRALVVRELLVQEAVRQGLYDKNFALANPDETIDKLLAAEIKIPEPDEEACRRYFENNRKRFMTSPLFEVSHIFFPAPPGEKKARQRAREKAEKTLGKIREVPGCFEEMARRESSCASAVKGGHLGQISKGQTVPAFEAALMGMKKGDVSKEPVETEVGFHIIRVHERIDGEKLPYEAVKDWIAHYLNRQSWNHAVSQYIKILAGKAKISGFQLQAAETPLVQ